MKHTLLATITLLVSSSGSPVAQEVDVPHETEVSQILAEQMGGEAEYRTPDGSRIDILTEEYAIEVEWCTKSKPYKHWQAPSQAVFYGAATNRKPKVVLLFDGSEIAQKSYLRCLVVCQRSGVELETRNLSDLVER